MCSQLICISDSSQGLTPLGGMRCSLNILRHLIIASKNVIMLPSNGMEKPQLKMITFLIIFYFVHSFPETRVQRNVSYKLNGSNSKKLKGRYAKLIFSVETIHVLKKTTVNR